MKLKELLKKQPLKEATMHAMTRESALDNLREVASLIVLLVSLAYICV